MPTFLKTCPSCGEECTLENVSVLPYKPDCIGDLVLFNCQCHSTMSIGPGAENYHAALVLSKKSVFEIGAFVTTDCVDGFTEMRCKILSITHGEAYVKVFHKMSPQLERYHVKVPVSSCTRIVDVRELCELIALDTKETVFLAKVSGK